MIRTAIGSVEALKLLKYQFLNNRSKGANVYIWLEIFLDLINLKQASKIEEVTHEKMVSELRTQTLELADIKTGSGRSSDVMAKTIAAVCGVEAFKLLCQTSSKQLQALNCVVRACALEADRAAPRIAPKYQAKKETLGSLSTFTETAEELLRSFLVDLQVRRCSDKKKYLRTFKRYGESSR